MRCPGFLLIQHSFPRIQNNFYTGWFLSITGNNFFTNAHTTVCCRQRTKRRLPGKTVQVVPHITGEIQEWIERVAMNPVAGTEEPVDVCVIELGGTIGDIESMPFIEALGHFSYCAGKEIVNSHNFLFSLHIFFT